MDNTAFRLAIPFSNVKSLCVCWYYLQSVDWGAYILYAVYLSNDLIDLIVKLYLNCGFLIL